MSRIELHRGDHAVVVDAHASLDYLANYARGLLAELGPSTETEPDPGPAFGLQTERRGEVDLDAHPPTQLRHGGPDV